MYCAADIMRCSLLTWMNYTVLWPSVGFLSLFQSKSLEMQKASLDSQASRQRSMCAEFEWVCFRGSINSAYVQAGSFSLRLSRSSSWRRQAEAAVIEMRGVLPAAEGRFVSPVPVWQQFNLSGTELEWIHLFGAVEECQQEMREAVS